MSRVCFFSFRNVDPTPRQAQCLAARSLVKGGPPFPSFQVGPEGRLHVEPGTGRFPGVAAACPPPLRKWLICPILYESYSDSLPIKQKLKRVLNTWLFL